MIRNKILPLALISATFLTFGCSFFSPEYERPKVKTPALWNDQDKNIEVTKNWDLTKVAWWREFNDPVLNNLINTALKDNNKLQVSIGNILQANAEINKANYGFTYGGGGFVAQAFDVNSSSNIPQLNKYWNSNYHRIFGWYYT